MRNSNILITAWFSWGDPGPDFSLKIDEYSEFLGPVNSYRLGHLVERNAALKQNLSPFNIAFSLGILNLSLAFSVMLIISSQIINNF